MALSCHLLVHPVTTVKCLCCHLTVTYVFSKRLFAHDNALLRCYSLCAVYEKEGGFDLTTSTIASLINRCLPQTQTRAQSIVHELFPPGLPATVETGAVLDGLVTRLSEEMLDDYPASDPRWAESLPPGDAYSLVVLPPSSSILAAL